MSKSSNATYRKKGLNNDAFSNRNIIEIRKITVKTTQYIKMYRIAEAEYGVMCTPK